ncbi:MAG: outer membrane protein assembly factor, partial [Gemmatimonadaceae bacterium]|nr:outer membrane protein assembly factor [Acetobacteraceae bacterium]
MTRYRPIRLPWQGILFVAALCLWHRLPARAADPQPYTVTLPPVGDAALDLALRDSSNLLSLQETAPVGPFALVNRARDDQARLMAALNSFGHYAARVTIQVAGRPLDDPGLPALLEAASAPVAVMVGIEAGPVFRLRRVTL